MHYIHLRVDIIGLLLVHSYICWSPKTLILGVKNPLNPAVSLVLVQPFVTWEDSGHSIGCVGDLNPVQQPTRTDACVIVLNADSKQLAHIQQLNAESVSAATLKQITELLLQLAAARVTDGTEDSKKDIGICACTLLITCDHNELICDRY